MYRKSFAIAIMIANISRRMFVSSFASPSYRSISFVTRAQSRNHVALSSIQVRKFTGLFSSSETEDAGKTLESSWNIPELKKEAARLTLRCHKKIGKASTKLNQANQIVEELMSNPDATDDELEACPDVKSLETNYQELKDRLSKLNLLEEKLQKVKSGKSVVLPEEIASLALELEVTDAPPQRQPRGAKKKKGPRKEAPRKPYFTYTSKNNIEIRVGRRSEDNDELSCNPKHGDGPDWWMHAAGCPGSHVVIRCHDEQLDPDVKKDAAALAARQSKCGGNTIKRLQENDKMVHIPSFLVGSVTSGAGFLMIHRELSHRQLLSSRWILAEEAEQELTRLFEHAKATMNNTPKPDAANIDVGKYVKDYRKKIDDSIDQVREFASKK
ncbi:hypothetical protein CTEN210_07406 [Chaetoceros tenuissimus]|uniref:NFACT RNA-binding domain-containing protein n=1 Tax=Chaetoceros tenuissimus TaxID=426638 RepID=A0AAD3H5A4_9STRA|nr:hypothetical protein CTEN210_07406 [Chaetoceros tenuissimus]